MLLLHSNYHPTDTDIIDHSTSPLPITKIGDATIKQETQAVIESGDTNWTDVDLLISSRTANIQDETSKSTITNT